LFGGGVRECAESGLVRGERNSQKKGKGRMDFFFYNDKEIDFLVCFSLGKKTEEKKLEYKIFVFKH
jgi:hypothetical protein